MSTPNVPSIKLSNGAEMPQVGFGLWKVPNESCADTVYNAIKTGYRLFDGACDYGNEVESGQGVAKAISEGLVKREELTLISKLWNSFHDPEQVEPIVRRQLKDWGIEYFDIYYVHFPISIAYVDPAQRYPPGWYFDDAETEIKYSKATLQQTWEAMEKLVDLGLAKSIAVSNWTGPLVHDLLSYARIRPVALQIEHHPYLVQESLVKLAQQEKIAVVAYSSFGPQSFIDCDMDIASDVPLLFDHPTVTEVAQKHGKTSAQVLLRWATQRGLAVIPKSSTQSRLLQNLDVNNFELADEEIKALSKLDKNLKFNTPSNYGIPIYLFP